MRYIFWLFFSFVILVSLLVVSCSSKKTMFREYSAVDSYEFITDSIQESGTNMSSFRWTVFKLDDGKVDSVKYATLYKGIDATGSIQIREENGKYNVKIIDVVDK